MTSLMLKAIVFLPLLSAVLLLLMGKELKEKGTVWLSGGFLFISMALSWVMFFLYRPKGTGDDSHKESTSHSVLPDATSVAPPDVLPDATPVASSADVLSDTTSVDSALTSLSDAEADAMLSDFAAETAVVEKTPEAKQKIFPLLDWFGMNDVSFSWNLLFDSLTLVMLLVVTTISFLVHIYSKGYMHGDKSFSRFIAYLGFFTFAMLMLVSSDNLLQLFFGWEAVGLASYLLIGFWHEKASARAAAVKAFLVNRVGDIGFALGIFALYRLTGELHFDAIFAKLPNVSGEVFSILNFDIDAITMICLLLFLGAMGKSAQFGLHVWLPDAMEGPTPVSALIHAATMVTAGVFMVARFSPLFELSPLALEAVIWVGAITAFFAGFVALTQKDIKRVIAYSTCSQLGFMFVAIGFSAYAVALFHLLTHAFFKALLFLGAGSVIHGLSGEQDLTKMGGVGKYMPFTRFFMWLGSLSLVGFPFTAGYWSKDLIVEASFVGSILGSGDISDIPFYLLVITAFFTSFYSFRLLFLTFHGDSRADKKIMAHIHESLPVMLWPLAILAVGALCAGFYFYPLLVGNLRVDFWQAALAENKILDLLHDVPLVVKWLPTMMMAAGFVLAFLFYIVSPAIPRLLSKILFPFYWASYNKFWIDEIYHYSLVVPIKFFGHVFWQGGDMGVIDNVGPHFTRLLSLGVSRMTRAMQTGFLYHYAMIFILGLMLLLAYLLLW
ncbi:MAG: NADH-quinone oxidoreductase subunit L [Alphaproteobacteria bacterium]